MARPLQAVYLPRRVDSFDGLAWNRLPQSVRSADTVRQFRRLLKTHYFQLHFGPK